MIPHLRKIAPIAALTLYGTAFAAVSPEEAQQLGSSVLTPWGAERAGNKDGSIPEWTGELLKAPADYDPNEPMRLPDPFKDKPLFTITAQNMAQYANRLTEGQKAMFKKFPEFRMDIYQSHRNATFPKWVLNFTKKNATSCKTEDNELRLSGCWGGVAFPIPKTGNEVMWNHITRYQMPSYHGSNAQYVVDPTGNVVLSGANLVNQTYAFHNPARTEPSKPDDLYWKCRFDLTGPTRKVGEKYAILSGLNNVTRVYAYVPGQRRVKLAPDLAYDTPTPGNGGVVTMDEGQVFLGALDRYDFKLVGKQEKYILYNTYKLTDYKACPNEVFLTKKFPNPDCLRWELHRVWVVDAKLKPGFRHIMPHRVFYWDEDTFGGGSSDDYDAGGNMYKAAFSFPVQLYSSPTSPNYNDCSFVMDLQSNRYSPVCLLGRKGDGTVETQSQPDYYFSPEAMAAEGVR